MLNHKNGMNTVFLCLTKSAWKVCVHCHNNYERLLLIERSMHQPRIQTARHFFVFLFFSIEHTENRFDRYRVHSSCAASHSFYFCYFSRSSASYTRSNGLWQWIEDLIVFFAISPESVYLLRRICRQKVNNFHERYRKCCQWPLLVFLFV